MKNFAIVILICIVPLFTMGQGRKDIKDAGFKTLIVYKSVYKSGKEIKIKESESKFDVNGNEVEIIEYDDSGKIIKHEKYTYNANNDKTSEIQYDAAGNVTKTIKFTYLGKFKVEKQVYNSANVLTSKKTYVYAK